MGGAANWDRLEAPWKDRAPAYTVDESRPIMPHPQDDWCALPILHHEAFNVKESWHTWNYTRELLLAGAQFCAGSASQRRRLFRNWRVKQEDIMAWHRENMAFTAYYTTYAPACARLTESLPGGAPAVQQLLSEQSAAIMQGGMAYMDYLRKVGPCSVANVTTEDLITAFSGDVEVIIAQARRLLDPPSCLAPGRRKQYCSACNWNASEVAVLDAHVGHISGRDRTFIGSIFDLNPEPVNHDAIWRYTLAFAYHKLVPMCAKDDPVATITGPAIKSKPNWKCTSEDMKRGEASGDPDGMIVYDLLPVDPARGYCYGELCRQATAAIDQFRRIMHVVTPFRTALVDAFLQGQCPFDNIKSGSSFIASMTHLNEELPRVISSLTAAKAGIVPVCITPSRRLWAIQNGKLSHSFSDLDNPFAPPPPAQSIHRPG